MNAKDFAFLRRKDLFVLSGCLFALALFQIALEQQITYFSPQARKSEILPFLILNHSIFEYLGLLLPIFTIIYLFMHKRAGMEYLRQLRKWITTTLLIFAAFAILIIILMLRIYIPMPPVQLGEIITTTPTPVTPVSPSNKVPYQLDILEFLVKYRNFFLLVILILPFLFLIWLQRSSPAFSLGKQKLQEIFPGDKQTQYKIRTILECYYQASYSLEERGADSSQSLTPTEFNIDVVEKKLSSISTIDGITNLFEEAKFSNHQMSTRDVELAKTYAHEIVSIDWLDEEEGGGDEKIKTREGNE
ncbi:MAG: DUF4129 domain-containing protein [Candidatus Heimdallarchaeota archaeon]